MADLVYAKQVIVPPQTQPASPFIQDISFDPTFVREIELVIPDGHAGITGLALAQAHQQVIPVSNNTWFISNDEVLRFAYSDSDGTGNWQAIAYNTDYVNTHTFYIRFFVDLTNATAGTPQPTLISASDIAEAGAAAAIGAESGPVGATGIPTGIPQLGASAIGPGIQETADELAADQQLQADAGLLDTTATGAQGDIPDLTLVQFAVAPPDFAPDAP